MATATRTEDSVVDSSHRAWGLENLFVVDGSVFPTQGAANPARPIWPWPTAAPTC